MRISSRKETVLGIQDRACQTRYRENDTQTIPWRPPYHGTGNEVPEAVEIDAELQLEDGRFDQRDVDNVKRFRQRKEWEKYLSKIYSPSTVDVQRDIVEQLEKEKWDFVEKGIDAINKKRLELAHKELEEQKAIIKERMKFRVNNARKRYEELKKVNAQKFQEQLEREIRRTNLKLTKLNRYPHARRAHEKVYSPRPRCLFKPKIHCEEIFTDAVPTTLNDAYVLLEKTLVPSKPFKKDFPIHHDCNIPTFYEVTDIDEEHERLRRDNEEEELRALNEKAKVKEKKFKNSKSLIAILVQGRATQKTIHEYSNVNFTSLNTKYEFGTKLYRSGVKDAESFEILVAEGIRDYNLKLKLTEKVISVIRRLEGRTISTVLDFTSNEYLRFVEQNRLLELAEVAQRDRWTREAQEAGRRQEEEQRLRQHEEMYKEMLKTHEITSDALLDALLEDETEKTGSAIATMWTRVVANYYKDIFGDFYKEDPYRRLEYAARLADRCLFSQPRKCAQTGQIQNDIKGIKLVSGAALDALERSAGQEPVDTDASEPTETETDVVEPSLEMETEEHEAVSTVVEEGVSEDDWIHDWLWVEFKTTEDEMKETVDTEKQKIYSNELTRDEWKEDWLQTEFKNAAEEVNEILEEDHWGVGRDEWNQDWVQIEFGTPADEFDKAVEEHAVQKKFFNEVSDGDDFHEGDKASTPEVSKESDEYEDEEVHTKSILQGIEEVKSVEIDGLNCKEIASKLLDMVVTKAEQYFKQYHENLSKSKLKSPACLSRNYVGTSSNSYQYLANEILSMMGEEKSKRKIENKIEPWIESIVDEASKVVNNLFYLSDDDAAQEDIPATFKTDLFYKCPESESDEVTESEVFIAEDLERGRPLEYVGVLDEKVQFKMLTEEDRLDTIIKKNK